MKATGWSYEDKPRHKLFCDKCKYLFTVVTHFENKFQEVKYSDIYESCSGGWSDGGTAYIFNHSDGAGDYHSGIELKNLVARYISSSKGWLK